MSFVLTPFLFILGFYFIVQLGLNPTQDLRPDWIVSLYGWLTNTANHPVAAIRIGGIVTTFVTAWLVSKAYYTARGNKCDFVEKREHILGLTGGSIAAIAYLLTPVNVTTSYLLSTEKVLILIGLVGFLTTHKSRQLILKLREISTHKNVRRLGATIAIVCTCYNLFNKNLGKVLTDIFLLTGGFIIPYLFLFLPSTPLAREQSQHPTYFTLKSILTKKSLSEILIPGGIKLMILLACYPHLVFISVFLALDVAQKATYLNRLARNVVITFALVSICINSREICKRDQYLITKDIKHARIATDYDLPQLPTSTYSVPNRAIISKVDVKNKNTRFTNVDYVLTTDREFKNINFRLAKVYESLWDIEKLDPIPSLYLYKKISRSSFREGLRETSAPKVVPYYDYENTLYLGKLIVTLEILALCAFPFLRVRNFAPALRYLAPLLFASLVFFGQKITHLSQNPSLFLGFLITIAALVVSKNLNNDRLKEHFKGGGFFYQAFFLALFVRGLIPEIIAIEKPMDFSFLNYFYRFNAWPPEDPWISGEPLRYYYFGLYFYALLLKLTAIKTSVGWNLMMAFTSAGIASILYPALRFFTPKKFAKTCALLITFGGSLYALIQHFIIKEPPLFKSFWQISRAFKEPLFSEFPLWSLTLGDLHGHFMSLPLVTLAIWGGAWLSKMTDFNKIHHVYAILFGFIIGIVAYTNFWDLLNIFAFVGILGLATLIRGENLKKKAPLGILFLIPFLLLGTLFYLEVHNGVYKAHLGFLPDLVLTNSYYHYGWYFGWQFIALLFGTLILGLNTYHRLRDESKFRKAFCIIALVTNTTLIALGLIYLTTRLASSSIMVRIPPINGQILMLAGSIMALSMLPRSNHSRIFFAKVCITFTMLMMIFAEHTIIGDRFNTIFKFINPLWLFLSVAAALYLYSATKVFRSPPWIYLSKKFTCYFITLIVISGIITCLTFSNNPLIQTHRFTLDGTQYMETFNPIDNEIADYINSHITGTPGMVETYGDSFGESTRISMHTGLPIYIGWKYHNFLRGFSIPSTIARQKQVDQIYYKPNESYDTLRKNRLEYIALGPLEYKKYGSDLAERFTEYPERFKLVFVTKEQYKGQPGKLFKIM